jgi:hypothetical protein
MGFGETMISDQSEGTYVWTLDHQVYLVSSNTITNVGFLIQDLLDEMDSETARLDYSNHRLSVSDKNSEYQFDPINNAWQKVQRVPV